MSDTVLGILPAHGVFGSREDSGLGSFLGIGALKGQRLSFWVLLYITSRLEVKHPS